MATTRAYTYNTGSTISGTEQRGEIAIQTGTVNFQDGHTWIAGPDESLGYIIATPNPMFITKRLVLNLDATNSSSYPGSGTDWFDLSGNNNDAVNTNLTYESTIGSFEYTATSNRTLINNYIITGATSMSMSAWFKMTGGAGTYRCIVHKGSATTVGASEYWAGVSGAGTLVSTIGAGDGVGWAAGDTGISCTLGDWYNTCAVWNGSTVRVFVNGTFNKEYNLSTYTQTSLPTKLGTSSDVGARYLVVGNISIVNIYKNKALTDTEVEQNYNAQKYKFGL